MVFRYYNEINFHKRKISVPRLEQSQTLIPFSGLVRFVCSELLSSLLLSYYTFYYLEKSPITQWNRTPHQGSVAVGALTHYTSGR